MFSRGKIVTTSHGRRLQMGQQCVFGGQGTIHKAKDMASGRWMAVKKMHTGLCTEETRRRLEYLTSLELHTSCGAICGPLDTLAHNGLVGYVAPWVNGRSLDDVLQSPGRFGELLFSLQAAAAAAATVDFLHSRGLVHGDLHGDNVLMEESRGVARVTLIDFDNFVASQPDVPGPRFAGRIDSIPPEVRTAIRNNECPVLTVETERYSLAVLLHMLVLLRHPAERALGDADEFDRLMMSGQWPDDPAHGNDSSALGGYPAAVVNAGLADLFRRGLSLDPGIRPEASEWMAALARAMFEVDVCRTCGGPNLIDCSKRTCAICSTHFPKLQLQLGKKLSIPLEAPVTIVGRGQLGGSRHVSARHALLKRIGPETWLSSVGRNGTYRYSRGWQPLQEDRPVLLLPEDRLRFADVEAKVVAA